MRLGAIRRMVAFPSLGMHKDLRISEGQSPRLAQQTPRRGTLEAGVRRRRMKVKWCCRRASVLAELARARATDESKRRRQGLVVCRATWPFEGPCDACPGVALAPAFAVALAAQARTVFL